MPAAAINLVGRPSVDVDTDGAAFTNAALDIRFNLFRQTGIPRRLGSATGQVDRRICVLTGTQAYAKGRLDRRKQTALVSAGGMDDWQTVLCKDCLKQADRQLYRQTLLRQAGKNTQPDRLTYYRHV